MSHAYLLSDLQGRPKSSKPILKTPKKKITRGVSGAMDPSQDSDSVSKSRASIANSFAEMGNYFKIKAEQQNVAQDFQSETFSLLQALSPELPEESMGSAINLFMETPGLCQGFVKITDDKMRKTWLRIKLGGKYVIEM